LEDKLLTVNFFGKEARILLISISRPLRNMINIRPDKARKLSTSQLSWSMYFKRKTPAIYPAIISSKTEGILSILNTVSIIGISQARATTNSRGIKLKSSIIKVKIP
jgi:hypothetical protein